MYSSCPLLYLLCHRFKSNLIITYTLYLPICVSYNIFIRCNNRDNMAANLTWLFLGLQCTSSVGALQNPRTVHFIDVCVLCLAATKAHVASGSQNQGSVFFWIVHGRWLYSKKLSEVYTFRGRFGEFPALNVGFSCAFINPEQTARTSDNISPEISESHFEGIISDIFTHKQ